MARTGDSPAQTKNKTEPQTPPDLLCANTFLCFAFSPPLKIFFFLLITTDALLVSQFLQTRLSLFPFLSSSSSLSSSHATWPGRLTDSSTHLKTKDDNLLRLSCFLSTGSLSTLHIINEAEVRCQVKVCSCDLKLCQECCGSHSVHIQSMT